MSCDQVARGVLPIEIIIFQQPLLLLRYAFRAKSLQFFLFLYALSVPAKIIFSKKYTGRWSHEGLLQKAYLTFCNSLRHSDFISKFLLPVCKIRDIGRTSKNELKWVLSFHFCSFTWHKFYLQYKLFVCHINSHIMLGSPVVQWATIFCDLVVTLKICLSHTYVVDNCKF